MQSFPRYFQEHVTDFDITSKRGSSSLPFASAARRVRPNRPLIDPISMMGFIAHPDLEPIAEEARTRLERVAKALQE